MTIYQQTAPPIVWDVESPLDEYYEEETIRIGYADLPPVATDPIQQRMIGILLFVTVAVVGFAILVLPNLLRNSGEETAVTADSAANAAGKITTNQTDTRTESVNVAPAAGGIISPVFSPEVQHWAPQISKWAAAYNLDPNIVATIMQIESCGDPQAMSGAGAQGLFQVMPFHFTAGEDMLDPETNAARGMAYYAERLVQTQGNVGQAFAGYNGGHVAAGTTWENWANETQRYFTWSTGIYEEASAGMTESATLQQWMAAGGASLCNQASNRLGLR